MKIIEYWICFCHLKNSIFADLRGTVEIKKDAETSLNKMEVELNMAAAQRQPFGFRSA